MTETTTHHATHQTPPAAPHADAAGSRPTHQGGGHHEGTRQTTHPQQHLKTALHRAQAHLALLERDGTHPIDLAIAGTHANPKLVLRAGESLVSAHSDAHLSYEAVRAALIGELKSRIAELSKTLGIPAGEPTLDRLQYGDQTES